MTSTPTTPAEILAEADRLNGDPVMLANFALRVLDFAVRALGGVDAVIKLLEDRYRTKVDQEMAAEEDAIFGPRT